MASPKTPRDDAAVKRARMVVALKDEREKLVLAGKTDRVREVDASIEAFGGKPVGRTARRGEMA